MKKGFVLLCGILCMVGTIWTSCGVEKPVDVDNVMSKPQAYVGSDTCKMCHLEHFDSWQMTLHSRSTQSVQQNLDALVAPFNEEDIREDLAQLADQLKVPADQIYIPKPEEIVYAIGSQWSQMYVVEREGTLYVAPVLYNIEDHQWEPYYEDQWQERPWVLKCGGCHVTGLDLQSSTFTEPTIGCEACHGKGSWHTALPKTAVFEKRKTIVNPAKLTMGIAVQICGSCHNQGQSTRVEGAEWPVGYKPGLALQFFLESKSYEGPEAFIRSDEFAKGHHQQYLAWQQSSHFEKGVTCTSCHFVHQIGIPPTRSQTISAGSKQCFECHVMINKVQAHSIHSFANCIGCHMPRIVESPESGKINSHVFKTVLPLVTLQNPGVPNSCQTCHKHREADLKALQMAFDPTGDIGGGDEQEATDFGEFGEFGQ